MATARLKMTMTNAIQPTSLSNVMSPGDHCHSPRSVRSIIAISRNNTTQTSLKAQFALKPDQAIRGFSVAGWPSSMASDLLLTSQFMGYGCGTLTSGWLPVFHGVVCAGSCPTSTAKPAPAALRPSGRALFVRLHRIGSQLREGREDSSRCQANSSARNGPAVPGCLHQQACQPTKARHAREYQSRANKRGQRIEPRRY